MKNKKKFDYCIVGGGIVGSSIAREIAKRYPAAKIGLLDKESEYFKHNSTRNSAVLHSGIYYTPNSNKANLCPRGNALMKEFIKRKGLFLLENGKFVVPKGDYELEKLHQLFEQGKTNQVRVDLWDKKKCLEREPYLQTYPGFKYALWSPDTAVCDLEDVTLAMQHEIDQLQNIQQVKQEGFEDLVEVTRDQVVFNSTNGTEITTGKLINCAGYDCLRISKQFGLGLDKDMIFLKGHYLKTPLSSLKESDYPKSVIYPLPPIAGNNFLGVHTTTNKDYFKLGPTASLGLSGRHYATFGEFSADDLARSLGIFTRILLSDKSGMYLRLFASQVGV